MRNKIIYMVGALLSSAILMFGCSNDDIPSYNELTIDKNEVFIKADSDTPTAEVNITEGNGNYKVTVENENIATATMEGTRIIIKGLKNGATTATVMDWAKHSAVITIKVKEDFDLILDNEKLVMLKSTDLTPTTKLVSILSGNGGYQVKSSDENIATAELTQEGKILVTAIETGIANVIVTDADGKETKLEVTVCDGLLELEDMTGRFWRIGETSNIEIVSGNGGYTVVSDNETVATAVIEGNSIKVTGHEKGEATLTITDKMELSTTVTILVRDGLKLEKNTIDLLLIHDNKTQEEERITILDGSGDYSIVTDASVTCSLSSDKSELIIKGIDQKPALNQTITLTDNVLGDIVKVTVKEVNYPFDEYGKGRYYIAGNIGVPPASKFETKDGRERLHMGDSGSKYKNGYVVSFEGGRSIGKKTNPQLYQLDNTGAEVNPIVITNLEIIKTDAIDSNGGGKYWIKFREEGKSEDSYIVTWT